MAETNCSFHLKDAQFALYTSFPRHFSAGSEISRSHKHWWLLSDGCSCSTLWNQNAASDAVCVRNLTNLLTNKPGHQPACDTANSAAFRGAKKGRL